MNISKTATFAALAEPTRLSIIDMLAHRGDLTASDISHMFSSSPSAISQHLKVLREAGLVNVQKQAQRRIYSLKPAPLAEAEDWLSGRVQQWESRVDALEAYVYKEERKD
jgi:DNA-binding transcriptional ArsR family regulator